ncbi:MAG: DUF1974 domain-containing protein, partial [Gammaproteobacteria bacterium]|nr:DUF1974 domain-containing protein [Gammaproteobacteria bacterium]
VQLGIDDVLGGADGVGRGWQMLSDAQSAMRVLGVPAASSGAAKRITRVAGAHARIRFQHPDPIGFLPGVQQYLARMASATYGIEALRRVTLSAFAAGKEPAVVAAITKYQCAERLRLLVNDATEVLGAKALCRGPNNLLEPYLNLPALALHIDGPNLVSRNLRIYGQGLMRSHPFVVRELEAVRDDDRLRGEERFDQLFGQHIAFAVSNLVKTLMLSIGGSRLAPTPLRAGWTRRWFRRLSRMTAAFAFTNDALLAIFGGNLKDRQCESARMAEIIGQLYTATAILKFYRDQDSPNEDRPLVEFALAGSLWEIQTRFDALFENLPPLPGWLLRRLVFPFGRPYKRPSDSVASAVAGLILVPSGSRNRLTGGICLPADPQAPFNILEQAHAKVVDCKPLYRKLEEACAVRLISGHNVTQWLDSACGQKVLDADEIAALTEAERIRRQALRVDDYGSD